MPDKISTPIYVQRLKRLIGKHKKNWTSFEKLIAKRAVIILTEGAKSETTHFLPPLRAKNATSAFVYGKELTDTIASWIDKKFVSGPFDHPPLVNFRSNPLMAVVQPNKVRPVMNLSSPKNFSLNDAIDPAKVPKIYMTTAKEFSFSLLEAGYGAKMAKHDLCNAYKIIPTHPSAWRLHGFSWLKKFFVDTSSIFGSKTAPAHFDCLGFTLTLLAISVSKIPKKFVHRTLDDTPIVAPAGTDYCKKFSLAYRRICKHVNVELAEVDPKKEKAFENSTEGVVLGIHFDSKKMSWKIPENKLKEILNLIFLLYHSPAIHLKTVQQLLGKWESITQLSPFAKGFRWPILNFVKKFCDNEDVMLPIPTNVKDDLRIWYAFAKEAGRGLPIPDPPRDPPMEHFTFISDAAGRAPPGSHDKTGVASIGVNNDDIWFGIKMSWPPQFTWTVQDNTAVYEMVGLLLPMVILYRKLEHRQIVLMVDNEAIVWAWEKRHMKNDVIASILIRCLHLLEAYISCKIHVVHLPRISNDAAKTVDNLSRRSTTTSTDLKVLTHNSNHLPEPLTKWLHHPSENWSLGTEIVNWMETKK